MVIKEKTKLHQQIPTIEETTRDMEQDSLKTTPDSPVIKKEEENE